MKNTHTDIKQWNNCSNHCKYPKEGEGQGRDCHTESSSQMLIWATLFKRFLMAQSWGCQQIPTTEEIQCILRSNTKYSALTLFSDLPFNYCCSLYLVLAVISC